MTSAIRMLGLALLLLCGVALAPAVAQEDPLVQRGVPATATAETAVLAREQALNAGQRLAYERMAASLGLNPNASTQQIESMVRSLVIESERITARTYTARITVNFNPQRVAAAGGRIPASPDSAAPAEGTQPSEAPAPAMASGPAVTTVDAMASYRSFAEWVEITRRLESAPPVARVQVVSVAGDQARLRLGLRSQAPEAALALASAGLALAPATPAPFDPRSSAASTGEGWRLSLAGFR
ncbi:hypothetical protein [Falsiroseomonas sp.]|uniref:hypothetical protein n=1 Tax=Falsiroseomonas sp. TaxID=2870721 RepID=UPI002724A690|nr:hypothetical protein [Falsiroseomonas sp.]MDO9500432.1 hypothetical protein [Falsiroseomonas sp.]